MYFLYLRVTFRVIGFFISNTSCNTLIDAAANLRAGYFCGDLFSPNLLETEVIDAEEVLSLFVDNKSFFWWPCSHLQAL
tara:strand:+ start:345 stop:581 length:237 start_codon:yes stop_codon:yes gene_type:complete